MITPNITAINFNYCNISSGTQLKKKVEGLVVFFLFSSSTVFVPQISQGKERKSGTCIQ